jgi:hypothetical protein
VNFKWTVTERFRSTDVFFLKFFYDILQQPFKYGIHLCFFLFSPQDVNKQFMCPANTMIYLIKSTMNPHKEKIIINRNISEIPYNIYLFLSSVPMYICYLLLSLDMCTHDVHVISGLYTPLGQQCLLPIMYFYKNELRRL